MSYAASGLRRIAATRFVLAIMCPARQVCHRRGSSIMILALRIVLGLLGALFVFVGAQFLLDPVGMGGNFGLQADGNGGLSTIRADMTAFFWVSGGALLYGVWKQSAGAFYVTAALMGITLAGRCLSLVLDGTYDGFAPPMVIEGLTVTLCLVAVKRMRGGAA
jgi:hypothetical protein